jgi:serine/threonine-protein kinase
VNQLPVQAGEIVDGKYRIEELLGVGGMGVVFAAHHLQLDDRVAIKLMRAEALDDPQAVERFSREARAAVKIKGEHVVRVLDVGMLPTSVPYMVMEYLRGSDLSQWVRSKGPLSVAQAVGFLLQAGEALAEAHAQGIVHRDLKPANLFVVQRPDGSHTLKVLDFGISKLGGTNEGFTQTAVMMGSPYHMAPEQMRSAKHADARSDLWAFGSILYELLTGKPPFDADNMPELVQRVMFEQPAPITALRADVPIHIEQTIQRCLQKDPSLRFQTVAELAGALSAFCPDWSQSSLTRIAAVTGTSKVTPIARQRTGTLEIVTVAPSESAAAHTRGRLRLKLSVGAVKVGALVVFFLGTRGADGPSPASEHAATISSERALAGDALGSAAAAPNHAASSSAPGPASQSGGAHQLAPTVQAGPAQALLPVAADSAPKVRPPTTPAPGPSQEATARPALRQPKPSLPPREPATPAKLRDIEALIGERH